ncbi:MAG: GntR family transcriptional regulator [Planctomycetota bacterium]|nr:GntR family transcriptional regulator [Planctomycetota bacterium]MDA1215202.1 GntR family transcriptional regulator [Planctomycetota bacterium]
MALLQPPRRRSSDASPEQTLSHQVANTLREEIIAGELAPGAMVAEIPTAERLGVSRLPVREATLMLEREGLLVFEGRGRRRIRSLTARDLQEILDIRLMLEPKLTALAAEFHTPADLKLLEANLQRLASAKKLSHVSLLDIEFHDLIASAACHSRLTHLWQIMRGQIQLFTAAMQRQQQSKTRAVRESTARSHDEIVDQIRGRNASGAAACVKKHLRSWKNVLQAYDWGDTV